MILCKFLQSIQRDVMHFIMSIRFSFDGFWACIRDEVAFRQEILWGIVHFVLLFVLTLPWQTRVYLTVLYVLLLTVELLNTSIEATVDLQDKVNPLAKKAKDCGSAAVFCMVSLFCVSWLTVLALYFI